MPSSLYIYSAVTKSKIFFQFLQGILEGRANKARSSQPILKNCQNGTFLPVDEIWSFWSLDLLEAIQGIAFQCKKKKKNLLCHLLNFSVFHHVFISSLDMFKKCINSYHIESKQVQTCLRILWIVTINIILNLNKFRHVWTSSDMFKNRINSYHIESE